MRIQFWQRTFDEKVRVVDKHLQVRVIHSKCSLVAVLGGGEVWRVTVRGEQHGEIYVGVDVRRLDGQSFPEAALCHGKVVAVFHEDESQIIQSKGVRRDELYCTAIGG